MLPTQVETRDDALAAWVASSVPAKVSKEVAASNLELRRAAEVGANDRSKPRALDAVFESLGAAI
jgi:dsRNA-specific ribonuclease